MDEELTQQVPEEAGGFERGAHYLPRLWKGVEQIQYSSERRHIKAQLDDISGRSEHVLSSVLTTLLKNTRGEGLPRGEAIWEQLLKIELDKVFWMDKLSMECIG